MLTGVYHLAVTFVHGTLYECEKMLIDEGCYVLFCFCLPNVLVMSAPVIKRERLMLSLLWVVYLEMVLNQIRSSD